MEFHQSYFFKKFRNALHPITLSHDDQTYEDSNLTFR